jgi:predicted phage terminase large subunit-like protein
MSAPFISQEQVGELLDLASLPTIEHELANRGLRHYIKVAWEQVEPNNPYVPNWHIDAICEHLEAVLDGEIKRLVINVPPGTMKSLTCAVFFPTWAWTQEPQTRFIFGCYNDNLSRRDSRKCRRLIGSKWYQERWGYRYRILDTRKDKAEDSSRIFHTNEGGFRLITSIAGGVTGEHAHIQVVDDPLKPLEVTGSLAISKTALERVLTWWTDTMSTRMVSKHSARVIIMQRLHMGDLAGEMLRRGGYEHLCLPMRYEPKRRCMTSLGEPDPRTEEGELLDPERYPEEAVATLEEELGPRGTAAQLQQDPTPASGNLFKRKQFNYYTKRPPCTQMLQSWDCTFKDLETSDFVVGQVWGIFEGDYYLLAQRRGRFSVSTTCAEIKKMTKRFPKAVSKLVEDKANGPAVVTLLKKKVPGLKLVNPLGGKEARANAVEPLFDAGNVYLPDPSIAPWIKEYEEEMVAFPAGLHDDQVDATTQALNELYKKSIDRLKAAMAAVRG